MSTAILAAATISVLAGRSPARAAVAPPAGPEQEPAATEPELSPGSAAAVKTLLARLAVAMRAGDAEALGRLLSPSLSDDERDRIVRRAEAEFERLMYLRFEFDLVAELVVDSRGPGEILVHSVTAEYEYEPREEGGGGMAGTGAYSYQFQMARVAGGWGIVKSDLFDQFTTGRAEQTFGLIFLAAFAGVLALVLWGWMVLDAWTRYGRARYAVIVFLTLPPGAAVYFIVIYLRSMFVRPRPSPPRL